MNFQNAAFLSQSLAVKIALLASVIVFFSAGFFHLSKFETTDEHFWKYERITAYYNGITDGIRESNWKKTRINDKPGVTVALFSGLGLPFVWNDLQTHRNREAESLFDNAFTIYSSEKTEKINFFLRFPILFVNILLLLFFFYVIKKITGNAWIAAATIMFIATSPVLIGISQVINPDALLWSFGAAAFFSYIALIKTKEKKFIILTGIWLGLALLSKYTANILPIFFILFLFANLIFSEKIINYTRALRKHYYHFILIILSSWVIFAFLMPEVFQKPHHFLVGTILSPVLKPLLWPLEILAALLIFDLIFFNCQGTEMIIVFCKKYRSFFLRLPAALMLFLVLLALVNDWTGTPFFPLENFKEESYFEGKLVFSQIASQNILLRAILGISIQSQNFIFSLPPLLLLIVCAGWTFILFGKWRLHSDASLVITFVPLIFFAGGLMSDVLVNPRYAILLYPIIAFFGALSLAMLINFFTKCYAKLQEYSLWVTACFIILITSTLTLWQTKPFYLTYESFLLPQKYMIGDSWGYGSYEAAQFINVLPDGKNMIIWTDNTGVCQFFIGKCIRDYKISLDETVPDYFVFSRRGSLRHPFVWDNDSTLRPQHTSEYYYEKIKKNPVWIIKMNNRPQDFVAVVAAEER